jgi:hypothetical protein
MRIMDYFHSPAITRWYRYRHPQARQNRCFFRAIWAGDGLVFIAKNQESSRHEAHGNNAVFGLPWLLAYKHPLIIRVEARPLHWSRGSPMVPQKTLVLQRVRATSARPFSATASIAGESSTRSREAGCHLRLSVIRWLNGNPGKGMSSSDSRTNCGQRRFVFYGRNRSWSCGQRKPLATEATDVRHVKYAAFSITIILAY